MNSKYPKVILLITSSERLKCCKIPFKLQFHAPNRETHPEEHAHHMLFMYLAFRNENDPPSFTGKLGALGATDIINNNRSLLEPFTDIVYNAFERYNEDIELNIDSFGQLDNDEVEE